MTQHARTLVVGDGGLGFAVLCARAAIEAAGQGGEGPGVWTPEIEDPDRIAKRSAAASIAARLGLEVVEDAWRPAESLSGDQTEAEMLLRAGHLAGRLGFDRVAWSVHPGSPAGGGAREPASVESVGGVLDRALLITRLIGIGSGADGVTVDAPIADLTDWQLADLAADLEAPIEQCWWWAGRSQAAEAERRRWQAALAEVGWVGMVGR
ncbi:MAG: hypothetical protein EA378_04725 [Phycisphaerales bacterium]|nr:MAG: hypothetical protein EA378_04725 [Phycisphaerales bacterium]